MPTRRGVMVSTIAATSSLVPLTKRMALANPPNPNEQKLKDAVDDFNKASKSGSSGDWDAFGAKLDQDVVLVKVNKGESLVGFKKVMAYLKAGKVTQDKEQFLLDPGQMKWHSMTSVSGIATWVDLDFLNCNPNDPSTCGKISYSFSFTKDGLIKRMYGSPD